MKTYVKQTTDIANDTVENFGLDRCGEPEAITPAASWHLGKDAGPGQ